LIGHSGQSHDPACFSNVDTKFVSVLLEQMEKLRPLDERNVLVLCEFVSVGAEVAGGNEDTAVGLLSLDSTKEVTHCRRC
jgi:hypothetical protein